MIADELASAVIDCFDSDGGIEPFVKGTVTKGRVGKADYCSNKDLLIECYCNDGISAVTLSCSHEMPGYVCVDGACVIV